MRIIKSLFVGIFAFVLCSCKLDFGLESASDKIKSGLSDLSDGLKHVDPIAAQRMFDENVALRQKLQDTIKRSSAYASSDGVIVLQGTKIRLDVSSYIGEFKVDAWNGDQQILIDFPLELKSLKIPDRRLEYARATIHQVKFFPLPDDQLIKLIDSQAYTQWSIEQYIQSNKPGQMGSKDDITLNYTFGGDGPKTIKIVVTPTKSAEGHNWNMKGAIVAKTQDGNMDLITAFGLKGGDEDLNKPQKPVIFKVDVHSKPSKD